MKIKKLLALILSLCLLCGVLPLGTISANALTSGKYTYTVENGEATITDVDTSISGNVTIPSTLGGYPVISIGDYAFYSCSYLTSITIPNSVTSIGAFAFSNCTRLTDVWYCGTENDKKKIYIRSYNTEFTNANWHYITEWEVSIEPTCTKKGTEVGECSVCGRKIWRYLNALGHSFSEWEVDLDPTCTEDGIKFRRCKYCGKKEEGVISARHTFGEWNETVNPTCCEKGIETRKCLFCSYFEERDVNASGHSFGEWEVTKNPTCPEKGIETKKCTVCGETEERAVNTLAHNYGGIDFTPATCRTNGERIRICKDCNHKETTVITGGSHIYKNGKCVSCDIAAEVVESKHNYDRNTNEVWTVTKNDADNLSVAFSTQTETEKNYDFIYIYDKNDNLIGKYSGTELAGETITVTGDTVKINLTSDGSSQKYGFFATVTPISSNIVMGDTNGNGELDADDVFNVRFSLLSGKFTLTYDINGDGKVNVKDLIKIKKLIAEAV